MLPTLTETITPSTQDAQVARTSSATLATLLKENGDNQAQLRLANLSETEIILPASLVRMVYTALQEMAKGHSVALLPIEKELTTHQAAKLMRVSRPSLIKLLDEGKLPYRKVGAHRRVRYEDVQKYLENERTRRLKVMEELIEETERLNLYK